MLISRRRDAMKSADLSSIFPRWPPERVLHGSDISHPGPTLRAVTPGATA